MTNVAARIDDRVERSTSHVNPPMRTSSSGLIGRMRSSFSNSQRPALPPSPNGGVLPSAQSNGRISSSPSLTAYNGSGLSTSKSGSIKRRRSLFRKNGRESADVPSIPSVPPQIMVDVNLLGNETEVTGARDADLTTDTQEPRTLVTSTFSTAASPRKRLDYHQNARLTVKQANVLLELCAVEIKMRGLAIVGIFRPLRSAESTTELTRLIELFLLASQPQLYQNIFLLETSVASTLFHDPLGKPNPDTEFRRKLSYANVHDVVALFKWALRRLNLRLTDLHSAQQYSWYEKFVRQEKTQKYPSSAFSSLLLSSLEPEAAKLFRTVFDLMVTISAHHVTNAMPAHRIARTLGYWLFGRVGVDHQTVNFDGLYASWERAGQVAEHVMLAFIREQASKFHLMPTRLLELVKGYPVTEQDRFGPCLPLRFRSVKQTALLIETRTENLVVTPRQPRRSPKQTLEAALRSQNGELESSEDLDDWMVLVATTNGERTTDEVEVMLDDDAVDVNSKHAPPVDAETALFSDEDVRVLHLVDAELQRHRAIFEGRRDPSDSSDGSLDGSYVHMSHDSVKSGRSLRSIEDVSSRSMTLPSRSGSIGQAGVKPLATLSESDEGVSFDWNAFPASGFGGAADTEALQLNKSYRVKNTMERAFDEQDRDDAAAIAAAATTNRKTNKRRNKSYVVAPFPTERRSAPRHVLNGVSTMTFDESFASVWQDQLMDECPAVRLPYLVCGRLNDRMAHSLLGNAGKSVGRASNQWLIVYETVIAPQPPKPPMEKSASSSTFFRRNNAARKSISAALTTTNTNGTNAAADNSRRTPSFEDDRKSLFSIRSGFSTRFDRSLRGVRKMRSMLLPRKSAPAATTTAATATAYESDAENRRQAEINAEVAEIQAAVHADRARHKVSASPSLTSTAVMATHGGAKEAVTDYSKP